MIRAIARDDDTVWLAHGLPHDLHRVLVRVGAAQREEHAASLEAGEPEQALGEFRAWTGTPGVGHETEPLGLGADRGDHAGMLVTEIAALGEAAHVEHAAAVLQVQPGARAARDRRCVPLRLGAPAMQHGVSLGRGHRATG